MARTSALAAAIAIVLGYGLAHGVLTNRWRLPSELQASAAKLSRVSLTLGNWEGKDTNPLDAQDLAIGEIVSYLSRVYVHRDSGNMRSLLIVCGRPGPVAAHTPEVCYVGSGMELIQKSRQTISWNPSQPPMECFVDQFRPLAAGSANQRQVLWSMTDDGRWQAPENPRWTFRKGQALYKLYLVRPLELEGDSPETDSGLEFLKLLIAELQRVLFTET
jgi:hypothetical protein